VIEAHLAALRTQANANLRLENKLKLVKNLYHLRYTKSEILDLYTFIDYAMTLDPELEGQFMVDIKKYEEEVVMQPYITSAERSGIAQGITQGFGQGERHLLKILLEEKFGQLTQDIVDKLERTDRPELEKILIASLKAKKIQDIF
jgi:hypothetical protein